MGVIAGVLLSWRRAGIWFSCAVKNKLITF